MITEDSVKSLIRGLVNGYQWQRVDIKGQEIYGLIKNVKKLKNIGMHFGKETGRTMARQQFKGVKERKMSTVKQGIGNREREKKARQGK